MKSFVSPCACAFDRDRVAALEGVEVVAERRLARDLLAVHFDDDVVRRQAAPSGARRRWLSSVILWPDEVAVIVLFVIRVDAEVAAVRVGDKGVAAGQLPGHHADDADADRVAGGAGGRQPVPARQLHRVGELTGLSPFTSTLSMRRGRCPRAPRPSWPRTRCRPGTGRRPDP